MKKFCLLSIIVILHFISGKLYAQTYSGIVCDSIGKTPVANVHVINEKYKTLAVTNQNGEFSFSKNEAVSVITFSHVGYHSAKINLNTISTTNIKVILIPTTIFLDSVIVSADLNNTSQKELPVFARTITESELSSTPSTNIDLFLRKVPGINVNRSWGIFSKNASITMRGLTNSASVLVALDGVPLNKLAGGGVNWNMMSSSSLSRIEVVKGPNAAQYGMNAMGGCINLQGRNPQKLLEGSLTLFGGTYNTGGGTLYLGSRNNKNCIKYYWDLNLNARYGDGYIYFPTNEPSPIAQKTYLQEQSALFKSGITWNNRHSTQIGALYSLDKRGEGIKVWEPDGSYNSYNTTIFWVKHNYATPNLNLSILAFTNIEDYFRQNENVNNSGLYQYSETSSLKGDRGVKLIANYLPSIKNNTLSGGVEVRQGDVDATDLYYTSTDKITYKGNLIFAGMFLQDDYKITNKLNAKIAFRYDWAWFFDGNLTVSDPTPVTLFLVPVNETFENKQWNGFSPKLSLSYDLTHTTMIYSSISKGFLPPKIEDMTKSGKIRKGFKMANPNLFPERLINYELGAKTMLFKQLEMEAVVYYSRGNDFQYFVSQGDSVDVGADALLPVLQKTNIADVDIFGTDLLVSWKPNKYFNVQANYTFNSSKIGAMNSDNPEVTKLAGKFLAEVPMHILGVYTDFCYKGYTLTLSFNYNGEQWYDDENMEIVEAYSLFNAKLSKRISKHFWAAITAEDLLDSHYIDRKGYLSPGRFILGELRFEF